MADIEAQPKTPSNFEKGPANIGLDDSISTDISSGEVLDSGDELHRHLGMRQIQLLSIGGTIGTASFVSIGYALMRGGPAGLFLAFLFYSCIIALVNNSMAEMAIFMPVSASFVRHGSKWVDDAWGFMAGWNFFWYEAIIIPFEITALNIVLTFWSDDIPAGAVCAACIVTYALINVLAVKYFGEAEFWLCLGKIILILILFSMTFITMVGGNPKHDAYGFRYWRNPGAFVEYISAGNLGRFEGFLAALWQASFTVVGPEYIATVAGEAKHPRFTLKSAFKTVYARFGIIFIGGALCVSVVCPSNDPTLLAILGGQKSGSGTGAASPYIIAMNNMGITILPHITNALLCTSIYSAGNTYVYCSTRALYSLALDGHAPKVLRKCTKHGVPIYAFAVVMIFPLLSLMQLGNSSAVVLNWLINLATAGGIINFIVMCVNYLFFYRALKAQGYSRQSLPYRGYFQPYGTWIALLLLIMTVTCYGYTVFLPGKWDVGNFFSYYTMVFVAIATYSGWKVFHRTQLVSSHEADLVWVRPAIDRYEASFVGEHVGFWTECLRSIGLKKS